MSSTVSKRLGELYEGVACMLREDCIRCGARTVHLIGSLCRSCKGELGQRNFYKDLLDVIEKHRTFERLIKAKSRHFGQEISGVITPIFSQGFKMEEDCFICDKGFLQCHTVIPEAMPMCDNCTPIYSIRNDLVTAKDPFKKHNAAGNLILRFKPMLSTQEFMLNFVGCISLALIHLAEFYLMTDISENIRKSNVPYSELGFRHDELRSMTTQQLLDSLELHSSCDVGSFDKNLACLTPESREACKKRFVKDRRCIMQQIFDGLQELPIYNSNESCFVKYSSVTSVSRDNLFITRIDTVNINELVF